MTLTIHTSFRYFHLEHFIYFFIVPNVEPEHEFLYWVILRICLADLQLALRSAMVMIGSPQTLFSKFFHVKQLSTASGMTAINPSRIAFTYIT